MKKMYRMDNTVQKYEWGTSEYIANLLGVEKKQEEAWAELWLSAHVKAPSFLPEIDSYLNSAISNNPQAFLGKDVAERYNNKLPYLFKILSAKKPLSIQAHPNLDQAKKGFEREKKQGILLTDFVRNYKDNNHKPELICALTEFHAMCGFRPASEIINFFYQLKISKFLPKFSTFANSPNSEKWKGVFTELLNLSLEIKLQMIETISNNLQDLNDGYIRSWIANMLVEYPNDIGVISPLFLNTFCLQPGEAVFLKAGILHAYLQGTGVEIMANSDNVLRGGLTPKNIDVKELVSILDWEMIKPQVQPYNQYQEVVNYQIPINEFSLKRVNLDREVIIESGKPTMVIVIEGQLKVSYEEENQALTKGESLFITSEAKKVRLIGKALAFIAATND